jgi:hypothetical protein
VMEAGEVDESWRKLPLRQRAVSEAAHCFITSVPGYALVGLPIAGGTTSLLAADRSRVGEIG